MNGCVLSRENNCENCPKGYREVCGIDEKSIPYKPNWKHRSRLLSIDSLDFPPMPSVKPPRRNDSTKQIITDTILPEIGVFITECNNRGFSKEIINLLTDSYFNVLLDLYIP